MRSFFNKPAWASMTGDSASSEFYRRSQQTYTDIVATNRQQLESVTSSRSEEHYVRDERELKRRRISTSSVNTGSDSAHLAIGIEPHGSTATDSHRATHSGEISVRLENGPRSCYLDEVTSGAVDMPTTAVPPVVTGVEFPSPRRTLSSGSPCKSSIDKSSMASMGRPIPWEACSTLREKVRDDRHETTCPGNIQESLDSYQLQPEHTGQDTSGSDYSSQEDKIVQILITSEIENTKPLIVQRRMSQRLRDVRLAWCGRQGFGEEMTSSVFLTWKGKRLFDVTTCKSLGIGTPVETSDLWPSDNDHSDENNGIRIHVEATTDGLLKSRKSILRDSVESAPDLEKPGENKGNDGLLKIVLKSPGFGDLKIKVRPHTEFSHVIATFRDKKKIPADKKVQLLFDGELLDPAACVQDHEITDLDLVDVVVK
jgi:hypothetical protein